MEQSLRTVARRITALIAALSCSMAAAQYPERTVTMVVQPPVGPESLAGESGVTASLSVFRRGGRPTGHGPKLTRP